MSIPANIGVYDLRRALEIERAILDHLPRTVGLDHPARQATSERIGALETMLKLLPGGL